jgi:hypothetical protein
MRKSKSRTGIRSLRTGVAVTATAAAVVAGTATPAFADDKEITTLSPNPVVVGAGSTVTAGVAGLTTGVTTPFARLISGDNSISCPAAYGTAVTSGPSIAATAARVAGTDNSATVVVPATTPPGSYRVCLYASSAAGGALEGHTADATDLTVAPAAAVASPYVSGTNATSITATSTAAYLGLATTAAATFIPTGATCPTTYGTSGAITTTATKNAAGTTATIAIPASLEMGSTYTVCIFAGNTAGTSPLVGTTAYSNVPGPSVNPGAGPTAGTNTIVVSSPTDFLTNAVTAPTAIFYPEACSNVYKSTPAPGVASSTVTKVTNNRVSVNVPAGVLLTAGDVSTTWNLCIYAGSANNVSPLLTQPMPYSVAAALTVTGVDFSSGPSAGGQLVTIAGTGFPTTAGAQVSARIGGSALRNVRVIDSNNLQGVTTPHAPGAAALSVTTLAGTRTTITKPYTYDFGITVTPNTAPPADATRTIYVTGAGFSNVTWGSDTTYNGASGRVFLVTNQWMIDTAAQTYGAFGSANAHRPVSVCVGPPIIISDNELICSLDLGNQFDATGGMASTTNVPPGVYQIAIVTDTSDATLDGTQLSKVSSGSAFTVADY